MENETKQFTELLAAYQQGNEQALGQLFPLLYNELHRLASSLMRREKQSHTLQATALVNEAFMKLVNQSNIQLADKKHFVGVAGKVMRQVLVDYARAKNAEKRGGELVQVTLSAADHQESFQMSEVISIDEALKKLATISERQAKIVELRYFTGLDIEETAEVMGISTGTVKRDWNVAKAWLFRELQKTES